MSVAGVKASPTTLFLFRYSSLQALHEVLLSLIVHSGPSENLFALPVYIGQNDPFYTGGLLVMAQSKEELVAKLRTINDKIKANQPIRFPLGQKIYHAPVADKPGKIAFLFPGFGSEHPAMLTGLEHTFPLTEKWLSMAKAMLDIPEESDSTHIEAAAKERFSAKEMALMHKGSLGIIASLAYNDILRQLNIVCDGMVGHSNGENAALIASGIIQFHDDAEIVSSIKKIIGIPAIANNTYEGQYLVINNYAVEKLEAFLEQYKGEVFLAMKNCPNQLVIYVTAAKFEEVRTKLSEARAIAIPLYTDHPYHTPLYAKQAGTIRNIYPDFTLSKGSTPLYSCVDAALFDGDRDKITDKAVSQWTEVVDFEHTINALYDEGFTIFVEVGPNNKLTNFVKDTLKNKSCTVINSNLDGRNNIDTLAELAGLLWINGVEADINAFNPKTAPIEPASLPLSQEAPVIATSPENRAMIFAKYQELMQHFLQVQERSWNRFRDEVERRQEPQRQETSIVSFTPSAFPLLASPLSKTAAAMYIEKQYDLQEYPFFKDHALGNKLAVIPFTVSVEIVAEAAALFYNGQYKVSEIRNASGHSWLALENGVLDVGIEVRLIAANGSQNTLSVILYELNKLTGTKKKAFEATALLSSGYANRKPYQPSIHHGTTAQLKSAPDFYREDLFHGPYFTGIAEVDYLNGPDLSAVMQMPVLKDAFRATTQPVFQVPGALLDCSGQLAAYWLMSNGVKDFAVFPFSMESYTQFAPFPAEGSTLRCDARVSRMQTVIEATFHYYDNDNKLLASLKGFKMILYQHELIPAILMDKLQPELLQNLTPEFLLEAGGIWKRTLAVALLDKEDYVQWLGLETEESQIHYLTTYIKNKYQPFNAL